MAYRVGRHWGVTIVRERGPQPCDETGPHYCHAMGENSEHSSDELVAVVTNGDTALAKRIAWLLSHTCPTCMGPSRETVGMVCQTCGTDYAPETPTDGYKRAIATLAEVADRTGSYAARWAAEYLDTDPDKRGPVYDAGAFAPEPVADSCTCTVAGPDPDCVVHQGRKARGPKPPNPPGCICDASGRTCPRHGAVT